MLDRDDAGADDFGHVGRLVQAEAEERRHKWWDQGIRVRMQPERGEWDANVDTFEHQIQVEPEKDLHQNRGATEKPDVQPTDPRHDPVRRQAHDGEDHAEDDADHHGEYGQFEGD